MQAPEDLDNGAIWVAYSLIRLIYVKRSYFFVYFVMRSSTIYKEVGQRKNTYYFYINVLSCLAS